MKYIVLALSILLFSNSSIAREYRTRGLVSRVKAAEIIFIAKVESIENNYFANGMPRQQFAIAHVEDVITGSLEEQNVKLITYSLTPEFNPKCCKPGDRYLVFGVRGYLRPIFNDDDDSLRYVAEETDEFVSSADGPFGVFEISDGEVLAWTSSGKPRKLDRVTDEIRHAQAKAAKSVR